jgi:hypothetical protein
MRWSRKLERLIYELVWVSFRATQQETHVNRDILLELVNAQRENTSKCATENATFIRRSSEGRQDCITLLIACSRPVASTTSLKALPIATFACMVFTWPTYPIITLPFKAFGLRTVCTRPAPSSRS